MVRLQEPVVDFMTLEQKPDGDVIYVGEGATRYPVPVNRGVGMRRGIPGRVFVHGYPDRPVADVVPMPAPLPDRNPTAPGVVTEGAPVTVTAPASSGSSFSGLIPYIALGALAYFLMKGK